MINKKTNRGFTLIETLISVLLLATALTGPMTIASRSLNTTLVAKDQIIAYYLAQDAVEYVRFIRDSNRLGSLSWLSGLDGTANGHTSITGAGCVNTTDGCVVDSLDDTITSCTGVCTGLKFNTSTGSYNTSGTGLPGFTRTIKITTPIGTNADEASLTVTITWTDIGGIVHPGVTMKENLFNWQ